ncbi:uncharacterized protein LOC119193273 [Manduca sexta]|uniref:uncharacterized protein LOC119193273 n=1 Tax=Manduca sexta TaxID=7130 RepID=UPI00188EE2D9|nr:uncharacterized protein LOC119193273 [Manduca sexta]
MEKHFTSGSDISVDSLEEEFNRKVIVKQVSEENVDTILVPFYEKDVLIKIPKDRKRKQKATKNYLVNKDRQKAKCATYLEIFRKQFTTKCVEKMPEKDEIRSLSPEFGDTERESIGEDNNPVSEFFNTESYNEIYYAKLMNSDVPQNFDNSYEDDYRFTDDIRSKSPDELADNNFRSISEVSQPRRRMRRNTVQPIQNVKLGGLGPDMEKIKPRLERARSLQRYSEKVRMENRLKIYKKSVQAEAEKKIEKELSARHRDSSKDCKNETMPLIYYRTKKDTNAGKCNGKVEYERDVQVKVRSATRAKPSITGTEHAEDVPPVQINFMVNVGRVRPSSTLKTLEEKHRMYQEQVKAFNIGQNNM